MIKLMPILIPDSSVHEPFLQLQTVARADGVKDLPGNPHITLASFEMPDAEGYLQKVSEALKTLSRFPIFLTELTYRKDWTTVTMDPVKDDMLLGAYRAVTSADAQYLHPNYATEAAFTPHMTLIGRTPWDISGTVASIRALFSPIHCFAERIDFSVESAEGSYEILKSFILK